MTTAATEQTEDKKVVELPVAEPTAAEKATKAKQDLLLAMQEEKVKSWQEIQAILDKGNFQFSVEMTLSDRNGVRYTLDLIKKS